MTTHSANVESSERLQRVLSFLQGRESATTREIMLCANVCAVNSCVSELRENGYAISCKYVDGNYSYTLDKTSGPIAQQAKQIAS